MVQKKSVTFFSVFVFLILPVFFTLSPRKASASQGDIHTYTGLGKAGYYGDGGQATAALLHAPCGVAADASGNIYISDRANQRIRKVDAAGKVLTVAGIGRPGYSGDGGQATHARVSNPSGIAVDGAGDVLFADMGNNRIRMISPSGVITTIAGTGKPGYGGDGGQAISAKLNRPTGVAVDSSGRIYIADCYNQRVRAVDASRAITTLAGIGKAGYSGDGGSATSASLNFPSGIAVDASGNIYISDWRNQRVRKIDSSGTITTLAGVGKAGFSGDGFSAGDAKLSYPFGVAVDTSGDIFIADSRNNRIRMVEGPSYALPVSTITTSPVNGVRTYSGGSGITVTGTASAQNGVSFVEVSTDGGTIWETATGTTSWSYAWNPPKKGVYLVMSRATDSYGANETIINCLYVKAVLKHVPISVTIAPNQPDAVPGQTVTWTATASGGSGNYQYQFLRKGPDTAGAYSLMQGWGASNTWDWKIGSSSIGGNSIMINAMDSSVHAASVKSTSSSSHGKGSNTAPFKVNKTITINSITPSETSAVEGDTVKWTAKASGGNGSYLYEFMRMGPDTGGTYVVAQSYGTSNTWSWTTTPAMVGSNTIRGYVKNSDGTGEVSSQTPAYTVSWPTIVVNSLLPSVASPATAGNAVTWTASASGGSGTLQYQFMRMGPDTGGAYAVEQNWSSSASWNWLTTSSMAGTNTIMVNIRNSDGSGTVSKSITYTIVQAVAAIVIGSITPSVPSPDIVGTPVTWTAAATGGSGSYQYQFSRTGPDTGGAAVITQAWGTASTRTWNPTSAMAGSNTVTMSARNSDGTGTVSSSAPAYTVNYASTTISLTPNPASATAGTSVVWTAAAGSSGSYQYQFSRTGPDTGGTTVITQPYSTSNTWNWTTTSLMTGSNTISVSVKDGTGATASATAVYILTSPSGLVGYWKFNEGSGATTADSSGLGNNGTLENGAAWTSGVSGSAASFNGTGADVHVPGTSVLEPASTVSVAAWVRTGVSTSAGEDAVSMGDNYTLRVLSDGNVCFQFWNGTSWTPLDTTGVNVLDNNWHHLAGVKSPSGMTVYVDGVLKASSAVSSQIYYTLGTDLYIGTQGNGSIYHYFNGIVDEVRIYNTALSATDVQSIFAAITPPQPPLSSGIAANPTTASAGATVGLTASASGGSGGYQYQFSRSGPDTGGTSVVTRAYSTSNTWNWVTTSTMAGNNTISVSVRDSSGTIAANSITYTLSAASTGNSYYISPTGSDSNNGSINSPWLTIAHASAQLKPGDTLYARGGTYYGQAGYIWNSSVTSTAPVTFKNYPGETPVFDGQWGTTGTGGSWLCFGSGVNSEPNDLSWIVIDGITAQHFDDSSGDGTIYFRGNSSTNLCHDIIIQNCTLMDNGTNTSQDQEIYVNPWTANLTFRNNFFIRPACGGIQFYHDVSGAYTGVCQGANIYNNVFYGGNYGIIADDCANVNIYNNTIDSCNVGIDSYYGDGSLNTVVKNNCITNCGTGLRVQASSESLTSDYNLYYGDTNDIEWGGSYPNYGTNYTLAQFQNAGLETSGNEQHSISANPSYVSASSGNYHLNSGSPAIDKGTTFSLFNDDKDWYLRTDGYGYDIGAYEYH